MVLGVVTGGRLTISETDWVVEAGGFGEDGGGEIGGFKGGLGGVRGVWGGMGKEEGVERGG